MLNHLLTRQCGTVFSLLAAVGLWLAAGGSRADTPDPKVILGPRAGDLKLGPRMNAAGRDLRGCEFVGKDLTGAVFDRADLRGVLFWDCDLSGVSFKGAEMSNVGFDDCPSIKDADFTNAQVNGLTSDFRLAPDQLMSTRSYKIKDLRDCFITATDGGRSTPKPAYDFRGANLTRANLRHGDFSACDFTDATIDRITIEGCRMTLRQLASTKNFKQRNLSDMRLEIRFDDEDADLSGMDLSDSKLALGERRVRIQGAVIGRCQLGFVFSKEDFYSTKDYQEGELAGITFSCVDMSGWDFSNKNLTGCLFSGCNLAGAKFDDALLSKARITSAKGYEANLTLDQIKSTWNFKNRLLYDLELPQPLADEVKAALKASRDKNEKGK